MEKYLLVFSDNLNTKGEAMTVLKVLNVGHGDSMILLPETGCCFDRKKILIDLGPGLHDITKHINQEDRVHIFITHHDADHLNGIRFFANRMKQVDEITVPFYQNEITLIAKSILSLKGMRHAHDCTEFIRLLEDLIGNQIYLKELTNRRSTGPKLSFAHEGKWYCKHITCLNPPICMDSFYWLKEASTEDLCKIIDKLFEPVFAGSMDRYIQKKTLGRSINTPRYTSNNKEYFDEDEDFNDIILDAPVETNIPIEEVNARKASYVVDFIMRNLELLKAFNTVPNRENLRVIYEEFIKCTHDACTVLKTAYSTKTFLLTGDASKKVFHRLIQKGSNITADYLKMPHHGSKQNISAEIFDAIQPKAAIISHNNRRFGKARDSLPNMEVLEMLESKGIYVMLTNDVCKQNVRCMSKSNHLGDLFVEMI